MKGNTTTRRLDVLGTSPTDREIFSAVLKQWRQRVLLFARCGNPCGFQRPNFLATYPPTMSSAQYVDSLNANASGALSTSERDQLVNELSSGAKTRAQVLRAVAENEQFTRAHFNRAFVLMQYFGYLRRNPNDPPDNNFDGYNFRLAKLDQFNGNFIDAEMVKAFITSIEYRQRFGP